MFQTIPLFLLLVGYWRIEGLKEESVTSSPTWVPQHWPFCFSRTAPARAGLTFVKLTNDFMSLSGCDRETRIWRKPCRNYESWRLTSSWRVSTTAFSHKKCSRHRLSGEQLIDSLQDSIIVDPRLQISSDNSWPVWLDFASKNYGWVNLLTLN